MDEFEPVILTDEDGQEITYFVVDTTRIAGVEYLLLAEDGPEEEAEGLIFRMIEDGEDYILEPVTEASEIEYISKVFSEQNEDIDIQ